MTIQMNALAAPAILLSESTGENNTAGLEEQQGTGPLQGTVIQHVQEQQGDTAQEQREQSHNRLDPLLKAGSGLVKIIGGAVGLSYGLAANASGIAGATAGLILGGTASLVLSPLTGKSHSHIIAQSVKSGASMGVGLATLPLEAIGRMLMAAGEKSSDAVNTLHQLLSESARETAREATADRQALGEPLTNGIMGREVEVRGETKTVAQVMQQYCKDMGMPIKPAEVERLINTGERVIQALMNAEDYQGGSLTVTAGEREINVKPSVDMVRALSLFLMAKSASKNDDHGNPLTINRGTMVTNDTDGRLKQFLDAVPTSYGRISSHFAERNPEQYSFSHNLLNGGLIPALSGLTSSPSGLQHGIEDYKSQLPSGGGCLLYQHQNENAEADAPSQTFLKFEKAGMPTVLRAGGHVESNNPLTVLGSCLRGLSRCVQHSSNYIQSKMDKMLGPDNTTAHREDVHKGRIGQEIYKPFVELVKACNQFCEDNDIALDDTLKEKNITKEVKQNGGLELIPGALQGLINALGGQDQAEDLITRLGVLMNEANKYELDQNLADLYIRRGDEVFVDLSPEYLNEP